MQAYRILNQRMTNLLHTGLLIGLMFALVLALGFLLGGRTGVLWAAVLGGAALLFGGRPSPGILLRVLGARPLAPGAAPELYALSRRLARRAGLPAAPALVYVPQPYLNAFALGSPEAPVIGVTEGLLRQLDARSLANIIAHEISHIRNRDVRVMTLAVSLGQAARTLSFLGQLLLFINLPLLIFGRASISWTAILLLIAAPLLSGLLQLAISRAREFEADLGAALLTGDPEGMALALRKLEAYRETRAWGTPYRHVPGRWELSTHPPTEERIARLRSLSGFSKETPGAFRTRDWDPGLAL